MTDRTISLAVAVEEIEAIVDTMSVCISKDECKGMRRMKQSILEKIKALPSAQPGWIPCTPETMPERDGRYVCTYIHDGKKDVFMFRYEDGGWIVPWYVEVITAWYKPLDPWEGGQDG